MEKKKIKAVELVRQIRDEHFELLKNKSNEEIKDFFHREAASVHRETRKRLKKVTSI